MLGGLGHGSPLDHDTVNRLKPEQIAHGAETADHAD